MKNMLKTTIIGLGIIILILYFTFHPFVYQVNYFRQLGIGQVHLYKNVVQSKGTPLKIEQNNEKNWLVHYDGLVIKYGKQLETSVFESITITSAEHRFGLWKIGIGTPRTKIESIYKHIRKIKDLPEDEFGVIDGRTWLWFKFDKDNTVSKIILTTGF